ncbi:hypothetical protein KAR91_73950 [Candidatus Pacearchaeota archaeon]|nr:hypothetical protein [Candidatus Pacearchaeota archaeon]
MANKYKNGDIVIDTVYRQLFIYNEKVDGWMAKNKPEQLKFANKEQREKLIKKGTTFIYY